MEEITEQPTENIAKLVINNQSKTELHKSPPLKTYGKKIIESETAVESRSRYGRERKHNTCTDFLSTDIRVGSYLKQQTVKKAFFKKKAKKEEMKEKILSPTKRGRGRPRKSMPNLSGTEKKDDKNFLNSSLPAEIMTDYQAPTPTSTETLPLPNELKLVKVESDLEDEDVFDTDWNCGDLSWAAVPSYPYWPCAITRDPVDGSYIKQSCKSVGRSVKPHKLLHVRFFGDNGRRSWVKASNLMSFTGLDDYQTLVEQICTPKLKKTDLRKYKMFSVGLSQRKAWQAAVSEAESLLASPRSERILYFENLYPSSYSIKTDFSDDELTLKKRKLDDVISFSIPVIEKKVKLDCNRYSVDLESLALQAAPITPRAIYNKSINKLKSKTPPGKRPYVKKSEWWLSCNNKLLTGIVAGKESNSNLSCMKYASKSVHDIRMEDKVKDIILNGTCDDKEEIDDDFAVPPAADIPMTPVSVIKQISDSVLESSKDVTCLEFETVKDVTNIEFKSSENDETKEIPVTPSIEIQDISMTELSPVETDQVAGIVEDKTDLIADIFEIPMTPKTHLVAEPEPTEVVVEPIEVPIASPVVETSILTPSVETPDPVTPSSPKKRGRRRKHPIDSDSNKKEKLKKESTPKRKTKLSETPTSHSSRQRNSKTSEEFVPEGKKVKVKTPKIKDLKIKPSKLKEPKIKTPKSQKIPKTPKPKKSLQDDSLEVRKFGYKGSKVFKKFLELNFDKIVDERPDLSAKDVEKYIENLWLSKTDAARQKFKSRVEAEASEEFVVDKTVTEKNEIPLALPSSKSSTTQGKKVPSIFSGLKDRVCQLCLKGDNLLRCKGPCSGYYHKECGDNRKPCIKDELNTSTKKSKGRKKSVERNSKNAIKDENDSDCKDKFLSSGNDVDYLENEIKIEKKDENIISENENVIENNVEIKNEPIDQNDETEKTIVEGNKETEQSNDTLLQTDNKDNETKSKMDDLICEKENVLPKNSENKIRKLTRIKSLESSGVITSPAQVSKTESVSSEDSNKSEDSKSESDKSESVKNSDSDNESKKVSSKSESKKGKSNKKVSEIDSDVKNGSSWKCSMCSENIRDSCFICRKETSEKIHRCSIYSCGLNYHISCTEVWPQTVAQVGAKGRTVLTCPQHSCHTCISDNPKANIPKYNIDKLAKCLYCPTSYHHSNYCVPAGSEILSNYQIICPRHYDISNSKSQYHVNAAWCFICSVGGSLICCDLCPNSFHVECLNIPSPEGEFICEDCETGRYPLFGEIVWVKLGAYRWWPAKILFPSEIPSNIMQLSHKRGEFAIKFFGSHDHYWINRGRVFLYHEGDGESGIAAKNRVDKIFNKAMVEAREAYAAFASERDEREATSKFDVKPPKYYKISRNVCQNSKLLSLLKPVEGYTDNCTPCECKPTQESPCGPNSDCINRLLMIECNPNVCPAKDKCRNQNFEKRLYPSLSPFMTDNRGWGLKTNEAIKKGDFIIEYVGEMIDEEEYHNRLSEMQKKKNENYYFLTVDKEIMLDAGPKGNVARFMNHSCDPNCETQKWTVNGVTRVGLFALYDIPKDTELVFNYKLETISNSKVACKCGAKNCTGFIGGEKSINKSNGENSKKSEGDKKKTKETKKVKKTNKNSSKVMNDFCFTCSQGGNLLLCDAPNCPNSYHLACLGLTKEPIGEWICPVHQCSVCNHPKVKRCALCINSYCNKHSPGNISKHKKHGLICNNHALSDISSESGVDINNKQKQDNIIENRKNSSSSDNTLSKTPILNGHAST